MRIKKNIYLMYAIVLLQGMVFYGPIATLYRQASGLSVLEITLIESISYLLCIVFEVPWGIVADKIGYKKTMYCCSLLYFFSKLVFWKASGFAGFMLERILLSVVIAGLSGVDTTILYLSCNKGESQKAFSIYNSLGIVGLLLASLIFSVFVKDQYRTAAFLTVISYGIAGFLSLFLTEVKSNESHSIDLDSFKSILLKIIKNKRLILFLIAIAFLTQTHQTIVVFLNQIKYEACGLSTSAMGYIYILVTIAGLLGIFSQKLTVKLGIRHMGIVLFLVTCFGCVMLCLTQNALLSVFSILLLNIANGFFEPFQMELQNQQVFSGNRATELSIYAIIIDCICAGTSVVYGGLAKINLNAAFLFGFIICIIGLLFFLIWNKQSPAATVG